MTLKVPCGQELRGDLGEEQGRLGRRVGRLEDDGVARGERRGDLPHRHHHRVVPRRHLADDADRLAADPARCGPSCTPPRPCPRAPARRRRRTAAGRPSAGSPRSRSARAACRCSRASRRTNSSARASIASANFSSACWRSLGVVSTPLLEGRGGRGVGRVDVGLAADRGLGDDLGGRRVDDVDGRVGRRRRRTAPPMKLRSCAVGMRGSCGEC